MERRGYGPSCALLQRKSGRRTHTSRYVWVNSPSFFPKPHGPKAEKNFPNMALHKVAQLNVACESLCKTSCGLAWDLRTLVSDLEPSFKTPWARWFCTTEKTEVPHHACWEVKSHHTSSHLSIAVLSPKDSHYSSAHFFIATGYKKRLVTSESCQIQGLSSEATIMTITDFKSKVALIQIYHTLDAPGGGRNPALWKSTDCS